MIFKPEMFQWFLDINWLYFCIYLFLFTIAIMVVISFFTPKADEEQLKGLTYFSQSEEQKAETRNSWSKWDVINQFECSGYLRCVLLVFLVSGNKILRQE